MKALIHFECLECFEYCFENSISYRN